MQCSSLQDLVLGDDTLLDHVTFVDPQQHATPTLSSLQQAVVLGQWYIGDWCSLSLREYITAMFSFSVRLQKTNPVHRLTTEEAHTYVNVIDYCKEK